MSVDRTEPGAERRQVPDPIRKLSAWAEQHGLWDDTPENRAGFHRSLLSPAMTSVAVFHQKLNDYLSGQTLEEIAAHAKATPLMRSHDYFGYPITIDLNGRQWAGTSRVRSHLFWGLAKMYEALYATDPKLAGDLLTEAVRKDGGIERKLPHQLLPEAPTKPRARRGAKSAEADGDEDE